jgi:hypothetical protein
MTIRSIAETQKAILAFRDQIREWSVAKLCTLEQTREFTEILNRTLIAEINTLVAERLELKKENAELRQMLAYHEEPPERG